MPNDKPEVIVTNIKMPFWSMVVFMVKWAIASIPAFLILAAVGFAIVLPFSGLQQAYKHKVSDTEMKTALKDAAVAMEGRYLSAGNTYSGATVSELGKYGFSAKSGVTLEILKADEKTFVLRASGAGGSVPAWLFDTNTGLISPQS